MDLLPQTYDSSCYISRVFRHHHRSECTNTLIYEHTTSRTHLTCGISLGSLMLHVPKAGDFVELLLLYTSEALYVDCVMPTSVI
jgi:hypothetical protein